MKIFKQFVYLGLISLILIILTKINLNSDVLIIIVFAIGWLGSVLFDIIFKRKNY